MYKRWVLNPEIIVNKGFGHYSCSRMNNNPEFGLVLSLVFAHKYKTYFSPSLGLSLWLLLVYRRKVIPYQLLFHIWLFICRNMTWNNWWCYCNSHGLTRGVYRCDSIPFLVHYSLWTVASDWFESLFKVRPAWSSLLKNIVSLTCARVMRYRLIPIASGLDWPELSSLISRCIWW